MSILFPLTAFAGFVALQCSLVAQIQPKSVDATLATKLVVLETKARKMSPAASSLLKEILTDASAAAAAVNRRPQTRAEALAALEAIQISLAKHNLVQPAREKDWPQTMGDALRPLSLTPAARKEIVEFFQNRKRSKYGSAEGPLYFVDCDMGAQLFVAVGEILGWDMRLVEIPKHTFVRWHLSQDETVNWDWTDWESISDDRYRRKLPSPQDPDVRSTYLRSLTPEEAHAYYIALIAAKTPQADEAESLFKQAFSLLPNHSLTLNNFAWFYATHPEVSPQKRGKALPYALAAWSLEPTSANYADTVACSFAASKKQDLALAVEDSAIKNGSEDERSGFRKNRQLIEEGKFCTP